MIPNRFPDGGERAGIQHRRRDALVRRGGARATARRPATTRWSRSCIPVLAGIVAWHLRAARATASGWTRRRPDPRRRARRAAHLDGRQGRRLGGHPAHRQADRGQRALVQRACASWPRSPRCTGPTRGAYDELHAAAPRPASSGSGIPARATASTCSTARTATTPTLRPNQIFAARPSASRSSTRAAAGPSWTPARARC